MKKIIIINALMLAIVSCVFSQKVINKSIDVNGQKAVLKFDFGDQIKIEAWNKNTIELEVSVNIDDNAYNDYYSMEVNKGSGKIEMKEKVDFEGIKKEKGTKSLCNFNTDINYTLKVPKNLDFDLNTISGEIELIGCLGKMDINTVSGFIDYSVPQSHNANIDLSTVTGNVYSNVKFKSEPSDKISWVGTKQELTLNSGETPVELKTVSGDIYLRKL